MGQLNARVDGLERRVEGHITNVSAQLTAFGVTMETRFHDISARFEQRYTMQQTSLDHVVSYVTHQEQVEGEKKRAAEDRDRQMAVLAVHQRQLNAVLFPILGGIFVALVGLLINRMVQDLPALVTYPLVICGLLVMVLIILISHRRAQSPDQGTQKGTPA